MNPEIIYTNFRDEALAEKFSADSYSTFVAMPLNDRFSYRHKEILEKVIRKASERANEAKIAGIKPFLLPETALDRPGTANVITEDIVKEILLSHFFVADLTDGNAGVLIETGIAMAFKPTSEIILITQHSLDQLHFDIKENRVITYNPEGNIDEIKGAFVAAAQNIENDRKKYVTQVSEGLTIDAIRTILYYASLYQDSRRAEGQPGLFGRYNAKGELEGNIPDFFKGDYGNDAIVMFQLTIQELLKKRMLWTHFDSNRTREGHDYLSWASHLTPLGWLFVKHKWPHHKSDACKRMNREGKSYASIDDR